MPARLFGSLRGYRTPYLRGDVIAGLTVWAVLVPEALAYASIAGGSPVIGLYAARRDVQLLIARDIGQVRDVIRHASEDESLARVYPTVQAAVDTARGTR